MGKRSTFDRNPRDFYPTPEAAVPALIPHLTAGNVFVEPCAGNGALIRHLEAHGADCAYAQDIEPQSDGIHAGDALEGFECHPDVDYIITNPPWHRPTLHAMIEVFTAHKPTWLLLDADWVHTKQAAPYMPKLAKIVAVGRLKWIPDSKYTGKDNCAWHLFDRHHVGPAAFYGRQT